MFRRPNDVSSRRRDRHGRFAAERADVAAVVADDALAAADASGGPDTSAYDTWTPDGTELEAVANYDVDAFRRPDGFRSTETVDLIVVSGGRVLTITRGHPPFAGSDALPGGFVDAGEDPAAAALREAVEETGVDTTRLRLELVGTYQSPHRDPRHPSFTSHAFVAHVDEDLAVTAGDDAEDAGWVPVEDWANGSRPLAFDHARILADTFNDDRLARMADAADRRNRRYVDAVTERRNR